MRDLKKKLASEQLKGKPQEKRKREEEAWTSLQSAHQQNLDSTKNLQPTTNTHVRENKQKMR